MTPSSESEDEGFERAEKTVVAPGDSSVKLFDLNVNDFPVKTWKEHDREV